jgi:hypothetical protein
MFQGFNADIPNGYQQITDLSGVVTLTVPAGSTMALITPTGQSVRWRMDGTDPTATVGYPLPVDSELVLTSGQMTSIEFIQQAASAVLNVQYFK